MYVAYWENTEHDEYTYYRQTIQSFSHQHPLTASDRKQIK